jgi:sulfopyruvate decarboxylase subunit alpha
VVDVSGLFLDALATAGVDLVVSLPDSWLTPLIAAADSSAHVEHLRVAREDDGVGVCAGAWLGGRRALLVCQNAGLLLATNALAGLAHHHQIPLVVLAADRGGIDDGFYYQTYKGRVTTPVLDAIGVPWHRIDDPHTLTVVAAAWTQAELHRRPVVVLATKAALATTTAPGGAR